MSLMLRIAAVFAVLRALLLLFVKPILLGVEFTPAAAATANNLAFANIVLAVVFWRTASDPRGEKLGLVAAIAFTALRAMSAVHEVLYRLDDDAAVLSLIDMIACIAMFVGMINCLPATLRGPEVEDP